LSDLHSGTLNIGHYDALTITDEIIGHESLCRQKHILSLTTYNYRTPNYIYDL